MLSQTKDIAKNTWGLAFPCDLSPLVARKLVLVLVVKKELCGNEVYFRVEWSHYRLTYTHGK